MLRMTMDISLKDRLQNEEVRTKTTITTSKGTITYQRSYGHVIKKNKQELVRLAWEEPKKWGGKGEYRTTVKEMKRWFKIQDTQDELK